MFWNRNKKDKATIANEKKRFNHLLSVADVTNGAIVIHTQRLKSDPGGNLLS